MLLRYVAPLVAGLYLAAPGFADTASPAATLPPTGVAADLPDEVERQIDEQTEHLPDEVREKIREKIKEAAEAKLAEMEKAKEESGSTEESSDEPKEEAAEGEAKTEEGKEEEKKEEAAPDPKSEEAKKMREEEELNEARFKHKIAQYKHELEAQRLAIEKNKIDMELEAQRIAAQSAAMVRERDRMKLESEVMKLERELEIQKLDGDLAKLIAEKKKIETEFEVEDVKEKLEDRVIGEEQYPDEPFKDGVLNISTRRIELNGPIMGGAADYVCQRLDYYNNHSDKPIFLVIDNCPGGSVMEGMHILQAIKESKAPVHVVVKRFAASMAAIIATLSEHSYCYPNAIILHHQASTTFSGNGRLLEDQMKMFKEISDRVIGEVAAKIGTTEEEFVKEMYENRSSGDWDLFGDEAVKRKWIGNVVTLVREEAIRTRPTGQRSTASFIMLGSKDQPESTGYLERYEAPLREEVDAQGRAFVRLPSGGPFDAWLLYNPNGYYR
ncbi:ATP-dependent Clp protease proteolytic subunit [Aeoliella sp. SH292]|uniref:ATP-dependent Clp protease proteolytic subunit n=1 Tax=Aeoliella sp. SH292 TaxID=3454464 RepID=UPI003F9B3A18